MSCWVQIRSGGQGALLALFLAVALGSGPGCGADTLGGLQDGGDSLDAGPDAGGDAGPDAGLPDGGRDAGLPPSVPAPIVLAHGFFGFDDFAGAGFLTYFHGVRDDLLARGETLVFTPTVDPFNSSEVRGAELLAQIETLLTDTGARQVNLIGHSQGGLDARWVAHHRPDLVASVTTVATPHGGSRLSDIVLGLLADPNSQGLADALVRLIGAPLYDAAGETTSVVEGLRQFSTEGIADFNTRITDDPAVAYFSIGGRSDYHLAIDECRVPEAPDFIRRWERELDPIDPMLDLAEMILDGGLGDPFPNDGLVRVIDARWGTFLGCIPADHLDEVGQLAGDRPGLFNDWDHRDFYADLVAWLRASGY